jgi:hypothetical protein
MPMVNCRGIHQFLVIYRKQLLSIMFKLTVNRLFTVILTSLLLASTPLATNLSWAEPTPTAPTAPPPEIRRYKAASGSQKVAKGTILKLTLSSTLDSRSAQIGESFTALVAEDLFGSTGDILLPVGSTLRGRVSDVYGQGFFGKGGYLKLAFDWVTLPTGREVPISIEITPMTGFLNTQGQLYKDPGYTQKALKDLDHGGTIISDTTRQSYEYGKSLGNPALGWIAAPFGVIGGTIMGGGYAVGKLAYHAVAKGEPTVVRPNEVLFSQFTQETTLPIAE